LIVSFYEIQSNKFAVIKLLKNVYFDFKISRSPIDLSASLKRINDCLSFCNLTENIILIPVANIKEKMLLVKCNLNPKASFFVTKIVERHD
jgi:hypothetical protein